MKNRNQKLLILVALICVIGVSIGFAAFSTILNVTSTAKVTPDPSTFKVVFSSSSTSLATNAITPTKTPSTIVADSATIDNSGTYPTISNLTATFTEPGQSVSYTFYARNTGKYDAYLTSIVLQNFSTGTFKSCVAGIGANKDLVSKACNSITAQVKVGTETVTATKTGIQNHVLSQGASETVTITLSYASNGTLVDGPVEVYFGSIYLTYGTQMTNETPTLPSNTIVGDINGDQVLEEEDAILLSKYMLSLGENFGEQVLGDVDINGDGILSSADVNELSQTLGLVTTVPGIYGDVDSDGLITQTDVELFNKYFNFEDIDFTLENADVNSDGEINTVDVVVIMQANAGTLNQDNFNIN